MWPIFFTHYGRQGKSSLHKTKNAGLYFPLIGVGMERDQVRARPRAGSSFVQPKIRYKKLSIIHIHDGMVIVEPHGFGWIYPNHGHMNWIHFLILPNHSISNRIKTETLLPNSAA